MVPRPGWYENGFKAFMKRIGLPVLSIFSLGLLLNCSSAPTAGHPLKREWMLVSLNNYTKDYLIQNQARIDLTSPAEGPKIKGSAFMGCNKIFFAVQFKRNGTAAFSDIGSTKINCPDMKLENDFSKHLKRMKDYHLEGHFLILSDRKGNRMKFIASDWD